MLRLKSLRSQYCDSIMGVFCGSYHEVDVEQVKNRLEKLFLPRSLCSFQTRVGVKGMDILASL
jgi:hypothetical protein